LSSGRDPDTGVVRPVWARYTAPRGPASAEHGAGETPCLVGRSGTRLTSTVSTEGRCRQNRGAIDQAPAGPFPRRPGRTKGRETHLSAQCPQTGEEPRLPPSHVDAGRSGHTPRPPGTGPASPVCLRAVSPRVVRRINDRATFEALRRSDRRSRRGPVSVTYAPGGPVAEARVAYAVGRRVGGAVVRNRLRRRLRAVVTGVAALEPGAYLVAADPGATGLSYDELRTKVSTAMTAAAGTHSR
jgi:ribonuclease P protein component